MIKNGQKLYWMHNRIAFIFLNKRIGRKGKMVKVCSLIWCGGDKIMSSYKRILEKSADCVFCVCVYTTHKKLNPLFILFLNKRTNNSISPCYTWKIKTAQLILLLTYLHTYL